MFNHSVVAGLTMADIDDAITAAGADGTVYFPSGEYAVDGLLATLRQTWVFQTDAVLKRAAGSTLPVITLAAPLIMIGGSIDGNRASSSVEASGVVADGYDFKWTGDWSIKDVWVGVLSKNNRLFLRDGRTENTGYMGVYWVATTRPGTDRQVGPDIERITVDRRIGYFVGGGIIINGGVAAVECKLARLKNNAVYMPYLTTRAMCNDPKYYALVGIELSRCYHGEIIGNYVEGGRIGVSTGTCPWLVNAFNKGMAQGDYPVEVVDSEHFVVEGNMFTGIPQVTLYGIEISGTLSKGGSIIGNNCRVFVGTNIRIEPGASNPSYPHIIANN